VDPASEPQQNPKKHISRLKVIAIVLTIAGLALFGYFIYAVGFYEIYDGISRFGVAGFAVILTLYFFRICARAYTWKLSVFEPYYLKLRDTIPAVMNGEALSATITLCIHVIDTSKAIAVRKRIPLVAGLSSVATENLFYSLVTGLFLVAGALVLLRGFAIDESVAVTINILLVVLIVLIILGIVMVIRQWHFASETMEWLYQHGILRRLLENGRLDVRLFENLIYGFYRQYPGRFLPICLLLTVYHSLGIAEVWYILSKLSDSYPSLLNAFLLESASRLIMVLFKLIPFMIGVDEAGAQFVGQTVGLAAGVGVTIAIIRKGRILFWTAVGMALIVKRGLTFKEVASHAISREAKISVPE
jgi:hypothetical protein